MVTGNRNRKHYIALCGELALEEITDQSYGRMKEYEFLQSSFPLFSK